MPTDDIARLYDFTPLTTARSGEVDQEFNQLVTTMNGKMGRSINNTLSGDNIFSGANTFSGNNSFTGNNTHTGRENFARTTDPTSSDGDIWYNSADDNYRGKVNGTNGVFLVGAKFIGGKPPEYTSVSTITVPGGQYMLDSTGNYIIQISGDTVVNIASTGLNGVLQSSNLTGTVAVTSGAATVTGTGTQFTTEYQVGDVIAVNTAQNRRILTIPSNTSMTVESNFSSSVSGVTHKRGGEAPNTHYNLYGTTDYTTPGLFLTTRNAAAGNTIVDLPSGYTKYRQLAFSVRNDSSSNFINFTVGEGWPYRPFIKYNVYFPGSCAAATTNVLALGTSAPFTTLSLATFVPPISRLPWLHTAYQNGNTSSAAQIRPNGTAHNGYEQYPMPSSLQATRLFPMETDSSQQVQYAQGSLGNFYVYVFGFVVTEVA